MSELFRVYQQEGIRKSLHEVGEYAAMRNPYGDTEEDVPRLVKEVRAEMQVERDRKVRAAG